MTSYRSDDHDKNGRTDLAERPHQSGFWSFNSLEMTSYVFPDFTSFSIFSFKSKRSMLPEGN